MMNAHNASHPALSAQRLTLRAGMRTLLDAFTHTFYAGENSMACVSPTGSRCRSRSVAR
jgi:hypothetical protein